MFLNEERKKKIFLRLFWQQRGCAFLNRKLSLGRLIHPSLSLFGSSLIAMTSERARILSLFFLSFSLSSCVQTRLLHSRLRDVHMKCTRHKGIRKQKREKENKKMCSRTPQKEGNRSESSPKTEIDERTSVYERTTRASSRISTPR